MKKQMLGLLTPVLFSCAVFVSCTKEIATPEESVSLTSLTEQTTDATLAAEIPETTPAVYTPRTTPISVYCGGYWEGLPANYAKNPTKTYPLMIYMSGQSQLGDGSQTQLQKIAGPLHANWKNKTFPPTFKVNGQTFSFILITPQYKEWPTPGSINAVINYAASKYRVDKSRIYVTGLSMGGGVTWDYGGSGYGYKVAAMVPVCGASGYNDVSARNIATNKTPVWAFHNYYDDRVPVSNTINYVAAVNRYNPPVKAKATIFYDADKGHDAWTKAYSVKYKENNLNMYEWMLQYKN